MRKTLSSHEAYRIDLVTGDDIEGYFISDDECAICGNWMGDADAAFAIGLRSSYKGRVRMAICGEHIQKEFIDSIRSAEVAKSF